MAIRAETAIRLSVRLVGGAYWGSDMSYNPRLNKAGIYNSPYWYSAQNVFYPHAQLPNCTCYAYGRWLELGFSTSGLAWTAPKPEDSGNAQFWFPATQSKGILTCSQTPVIGSIACWKRSDNGRGHVAIVEIVNPDGSIVISQSGYARPITTPVYDMPSYFTTKTLYPNDNYYSIYGYITQGFIYPPNVQTLDWLWEVTDAAPTLPTGYKENNARLVYGVLLSYGWALESICGVLGNMENEGNLQPGQCEYGHGLPLYDPVTGIPTNPYYLPNGVEYYGLGLCGWTAWSSSPRNIILQTAIDEQVPWYNGTMQCRILNQADQMGYWSPDLSHGYPGTFTEFKTNSYGRSVEDLASTFLWAYEHPNPQYAHEAARRTQARYWYNYLQDMGPVIPSDDDTNPNHYINKMPIWAMIRYH